MVTGFGIFPLTSFAAMPLVHAETGRTMAMGIVVDAALIVYFMVVQNQQRPRVFLGIGRMARNRHGRRCFEAFMFRSKMA